LVPGHDPQAFAAALVPYLVDPRARAAAGEAGRRNASRHDWHRTATATLDVYRAVLARSDPAQRGPGYRPLRSARPVGRQQAAGHRPRSDLRGA
ncbi:MAG: hypothetical protein M3N52_13675, partial [Actinomycetota bacterium]|nr:hypothetical protein [Actinomycetota bacterium]